ncbi:lipoprotein-releasing ABC transporter permease subunit [Gilvimarinus sp. SDUM040013]|uniref:Lipoprotein-releasing ABC transporter permease subunit n=1 Tax=Gilvimarinus gilvus TaxID=3058038 RepID=A0ABU4S6B5_9GAMM|nr:lipoprotein-releasing ABC transporter permease subunit [Gilvimarinus sp. SDUM040013]MDO3387156.1 lipoprotein-releasing ABC transporter permease subunit [Gilvimarinus sp. SDUM040013]MDX6850899.1 lipoprotein-releasing ABC transporter permease subunit [Gilvimarinus sp. SDUM040013]
MLKNVPLMIGLRYIRAKRRHQFISFVSGFSLVGMALGVMALIIVLSVMNGFDREMKSRVLQVVPHGFIEHKAGLDNWQALRQQLVEHPEVVGAAPSINGFALLSRGARTTGVEFSAIHPQLQPEVSKVARSMIMGSIEDVKPGEFGVVLGVLLARKLGAMPGDKVTLTLPEVRITPAGVYPRVKRFTVKGVFEVGAPVDQQLALVHLDDMQRLQRLSSPTGLQVEVTDIYRAGEVLAQLKPFLPDEYEISDWSHSQGSLFQAVKMEKMMVGVLLSTIIAVAAFNIVSSLVLMVSDKRSDIAVLRTMGLTARQVVVIFLVQGVGVGVLGIGIGATLGVLGALYISDLVTGLEKLVGLKVFDPNVYFISEIPSHMYISDVAAIAVTALCLSFLATVYPAWRAGQIEPAEALRYE